MIQDKKKQSKIQEKKRIDQQTLRNADDFIKEIKAKLQPISLKFLPININYSTIEQQSTFPFNINTSDPKYFQSPPVEQQIEAEFVKKISDYKRSYIQFEVDRQIRSTENNKKIDENLKILENQWKHNNQKRQLTLTENSLTARKFIRNINIEDYKYIIIQTFTEWIGLKNKVTKQIDQLKKIPINKEDFLTRIFSAFKKQQQKKQIQINPIIQNIVNQSFLLIQNWHLGQRYQTRIICIHNDPQIQEGHCYLYTEEHSISIPPSLQPLTPRTAQRLKRKLIFAYFASKNKQRAQKINEKYLQNTKSNISNNLIFNNLKDQFIQKPPVEIINLKNQQKIYSDYPKQNMQNFIQRWKDKANFYHKNSKTYVYLQPKFIYIPKTHLAKGVKLNINNIADQSFDFVGQNQKSFQFQPKKFRNYAFNLESFQDSHINFNVLIQNESGKSTEFKNKISLSKIENQALGYSYEIGLIPDNPNVILDYYKGDFPYILAFDAVIRKASQFQTPQNLMVFRQVNLLTKIGKIPNIYSSYYFFNYSPQLHPLVSQILTGQQTPINQKNFQKTYLQFVHFFQRQENKSQNYCQYLKLKRAKTSQYSGFVIRDRYTKYCQHLKQKLTDVQNNYNNMLRNNAKINKFIIKKQFANLNDDIKNCKLYNSNKIKQMLERYIVFQFNNVKKDAKLPKRYGSNFAMIKIADQIIQIFQRSEVEGSKKTKTDINELTVFFITFMEILYPYQFNNAILQQDLLYLRILAKKYLPQFNYLLNRKGIGLENYASELLLELFTSLPMQLCYRIWDHMICNLDKLQHVRLLSVYTLMIYQQKSSLLPIYPINQIIQSIYINSGKIKLDKSNHYNMTKLIQNNKAPIVQRQKKIIQLAKFKYLRRFIFGVNSKTDMLDEDDFFRPTDQFNNNLKSQSQVNQRVHTKLMSLKQINYPLPTPGYQGFPITKVYLFIGGIFLLNNLNIHSKQYRLQINLADGTSLMEIPITDKSSFVNKFIQLDFSNSNTSKKTKPVVQFRLIQKPNIELLSAKLKLNGYHKDVVYRQNINLNKNKKIKDYQLNNLGTSVLNLSLVIKSTNQANQVDLSQEKNRRQAQFLQKVLDFDLQPENSQSVKAVNKLDKKFKKILDPLDQLNVQKYLRLKVSTSFNSRVPQWIKVSKVSIEQLKAIFSYVFLDQSQKNIRLNFPKFYQSYAENFQKFTMSQFLLDLILMSEVTKLKKLSMIYCIGVHYQNITQSTSSQQMSVQTLNSIIKQIIKSTGFINSCPFTKQFSGQILYGCYYEKGNKVQQNKRQITEILQDWVYLSQIKSGYRGIILGSVEDLSILQSMLPAYILTQIQRQKLCRFQIQYKIKGEVYIWSATVNTSDFSIVKRGVKFLNNYPKYQQNPQYFTSVAELMYNCQNLISLQQNATIDYQQFVNIFRNNSLLDYLLTYNQYITQNSQSKDKTSYLNYQFKNLPPIERNLSSSVRNTLENNSQDFFYSDFALFRGQNCIPTWQRCKVINDQGKTLVSVAFFNKQGQYFVPRYEIICLDEVQIIQTAKRIPQISQSVISDQNRYRE